MSMLAEPKRKQKWTILERNVNKNNNWSKDSNKFGQKLLERMGWKEGKGLGRNEDGLTDYVKVRYKANTKGVGFKESVEWSAQQDNFNELLDDLADSKGDTENKVQEVKSLEEKSQNSRARVHYKKFTRGKDLSRYSEKDLANIFGKKKLSEIVKERNVDEQDGITNNNGVLTIAGGSMVDYFKNKKSNFGKAGGFNNSNNDLDDSEDNSATFGFGFNNKKANGASDADNVDCSATFSSNVSGETNTFKKNKKSKDKSKNTESKNTFVSYVSEDDDSVTSKKKKTKTPPEEPKQTPKKRKGDLLETSDETLDTPSKKKLKFEASPVEVPKKSKKSKKRQNEEILPNLGVTNPAFEPLNTNITVKKHILGTIIENETENDLNESKTVVIEENSKAKKKKSKTKGEPGEESVKDDSEINFEQSTSEAQSKRKKNKKKENNDSNFLAVDNPNFNVSNEAGLNATSEELEVKRKKKRKDKGVDNPALNDSCLSLAESQLEESKLAESDNTKQDYEVKRKKKKSRGLDNPALNDSCSSLAESQLQETQDGSKISKKGNLESDNTTQDYEVTHKKKKKSKGLDNPALNLSDSAPDLSQNNGKNSDLADASTENYEVMRKNKKKSKGLDNPALNVHESSSSLAESLGNQNENKNVTTGVNNAALETSDCDIMLNVTDEPVKTSRTPKVDKNMRNKSKNVRFSKTNQEYVISNRSPGDIDKRNELYDINTKVIQDGLRDLKKQKNLTPTKEQVNHAFDIKSVDKIDFCDDGSSKSPRKRPRNGIDNQAFDAKAQKVEETVSSLTKTIENYQAEVENDINEVKAQKAFGDGCMVGELNNSDGENEEHEEGVKLRFKYASFSKFTPAWAKRNDASSTGAKKSYKHLIKGDIILGFKGANLHKVDGYGMKKTGRIE